MSKNKNIMILFLSNVRPDKNNIINKYPYKYIETTRDANYIFDIEGVQTNEAAVKAVIELLHKTQQKLSTVYMLCTDTVLKGEIKGLNETHKDFFERRIVEFCKDKYTAPEFFEPIDYDEKSTGDAVFTQIIDMANKIEKDYSSSNVTVYADMTGGMRNSSMLMLSIMRLLEYNGKKVEKVLYSNWSPTTGKPYIHITNNYSKDAVEKQNDEKTTHNIIDNVTNIYELNNLIAGAEEFNKFGSADTLSKYFKSKNSCSNSLNDLIDSMKNFSNNIKLCRADIFIKATDDLSINIKLFTEYFKKHFDKTNTNDRIFSLLLPMIEDSYKEILNNTNESKCKQYIEIIKWCNKRGLLQQALTLYVELVPEYLESCNEGKSLEIVSKFIHKKQPPDTAQPEHYTDKAIHKFIDHRNAKNIKREPLDFEIIKPILLSYYSIKSERNATSHANEDKISSANNSDNIDIGTNECNRISEMLSNSIKLIEDSTTIS